MRSRMPSARPSTTPALTVACVIGDGEAETGPLAASWHSNKFLDPVRDGAVLPILHLNGYKIASPTVLARIPEHELRALLTGYGWRPLMVSGGFDGEDPARVHQLLAETLDEAFDEIARIQEVARTGGSAERPTWPMIVLRTPKGWTCPAVVDGLPVEGTWRAHQVPIAQARQNDAHRELLEQWMRSYRPEELFDEDGALVAEVAALAPAGERRMSAIPHANGGTLLRDLILPSFGDYAVAVARPGRERSEATRVLGAFLRDVTAANRRQLPHRRAGRDHVEPAHGRVRDDDARVAGRARRDGREPGAGRAGHGGALGASLPGLARGLPPDGAPRSLQLLRGLHPHRRLDVQPAREMAQDLAADPLAHATRVTQLPAHLACMAAGPQRLLAPGPRIHRSRDEQEGRGHPRVPAARYQLPVVGDGSLPAQPQLRQCRRGGQGAGADVSDNRRGDGPLRPRNRRVGVGLERRGSRARRRHGVLWRRADARDAGRRRAPARAPAGVARPRRQRRRSDAAPARQRASARIAGRGVRRALHASTGRSSSPTTAIRG